MTRTGVGPELQLAPFQPPASSSSCLAFAASTLQYVLHMSGRKPSKVGATGTRGGRVTAVEDRVDDRLTVDREREGLTDALSSLKSSRYSGIPSGR